MSGTNVIPGFVRDSLIGGVHSQIVAILNAHNGNQGGGLAHGVGSPVVYDRTDGFIITEPLPANPTLAGEHWEIVGWSVNIRIAVALGSTGQIRFSARYGNIWAGIIKDLTFPGPTPVLPIWPKAQFPADLSTFIKLWDGENDPIAVVNSNSNKVDNYSLISATTVLPFPLTVQPGSQLSFAVIMEPSTIEASLTLWITSIQFAVNYNIIKGS